MYPLVVANPMTEWGVEKVSTGDG